MHVILEGVLPRTCCRLLYHCIFEEHCFSLSELNKIISTFPYGEHEKGNSPRTIDRERIAKLNDKLGQSGIIISTYSYPLNLLNLICSITDVATRSTVAINGW